MFNLLLLSSTSNIIIWSAVAGLIVLLVAVLAAVVPFKIYIRCMMSGAYIGIARLVGMKLRNINLKLISNSYISAKKGGLRLNVSDLENHYLAGGNIDKVVSALIAANSAKISLSVENAKAIDLAGRDVHRAIQEYVTPRVIETPEISAVAKDGIELIVKAKVTVRTNLERLVGGSGERTIISRVGEGIVTTVGSAASYGQVLQNPDAISSVIQEKGLDDGTAFQILSIDIADVSVGRNIGADLKSLQAESDKKIAQAKAEERKAEAIAMEQEMRAESEKMRAQVLRSEAEVPKALAEAFKTGKIGVMDYYKMQNLISDTTMRNALGGKADAKTSPKRLPPNKK